jgi:hypothetical protein
MTVDGDLIRMLQQTLAAKELEIADLKRQLVTAHLRHLDLLDLVRGTA